MSVRETNRSNLSDSGVEAVDTPYPHDDGELRFRRDVEVAVFAGVARQAQFVRLRLPILLHVLLSALEDGGAFGLRLVSGGKWRRRKGWKEREKARHAGWKEKGTERIERKEERVGKGGKSWKGRKELERP